MTLPTKKLLKCPWNFFHIRTRKNKRKKIMLDFKRKIFTKIINRFSDSQLNCCEKKRLRVYCTEEFLCPTCFAWRKWKEQMPHSSFSMHYILSLTLSLSGQKFLDARSTRTQVSTHLSFFSYPMNVDCVCLGFIWYIHCSLEKSLYATDIYCAFFFYFLFVNSDHVDWWSACDSFW